MILRAYQQDAVQSIFDYFYSNQGNPVVSSATGTGKSVIIAEFLRLALHMDWRQKFIVATHVKELIEQDYYSILAHWETAPIGINSSSLNRRCFDKPIIVAGIQSVYKKASDFGFVHLLLIDEAHLLSSNENSMYIKFIEKLKETNPALKVIGFTATPFRLKGGMLTDCTLFDKICYDNTRGTSLKKMIHEGYLSPLVGKATQNPIDVSQIRTVRGEFDLNQLEESISKDREKNKKALTEMLSYMNARNHVLIFGCTIRHCEMIKEILSEFTSDRAEILHSNMTKTERESIVTDFKAGEIKYLANVNILSTGFDFPAIDGIVSMRPTQSVGLHVQQAGRGLRIAQGKADCLYLDYAGNIARLGTIDNPMIPTHKRKGNRVGEAPVKICPSCMSYCHTTCRVCPDCGHQFPISQETKISTKAHNVSPLSEPIVSEWADVSYVLYEAYTRRNQPECMKITYYCGYTRIYQFVCLNHVGFSRYQAEKFWKDRIGLVPESTAHGLSLTSHLPRPVRIEIWTNRKHPEVLKTLYENGLCV